MATIKLQPSGKVLIKDGKVSCGCCGGGCGCGRILLPPNLFETLKNATSAFIWGYNTNEFLPGMPEDDFFWLMNAFFPGGGFPLVSYDIFVEMTYFKNGCLYFRGEYYTLLLTDPDSLALYGDPVTCDLGDETYVTGTASINGEGGFAYYYATNNDLGAPPVPNIVFS